MADSKRRIASKLPRAPFRFGNGSDGTLLRNIIENAAVTTFLVDAQGDVVYANRAFGELLGYDPEECVGLGIASIVHPDDAALVRAQSDNVSGGKAPGYKAERRYLRRNGEAVWVLTSAAAIVGADGSHLYTAVQAVDPARLPTWLPPWEIGWGWELPPAPGSDT